jgi:hypothetical protein
LPEKEGGYLILSEFQKENSNEILKSRRYIRIGNNKNIAFPRINSMKKFCFTGII